MTRLIDADALSELINGGYDLDFDEVAETKRELLRMISEQPTINAVPVRHAHWFYYPNWEEEGECCYECSACGMGSEVDYDYCPNCGARMDEE